MGLGRQKLRPSATAASRVAAKERLLNLGSEFCLQDWLDAVELHWQRLGLGVGVAQQSMAF